MPPELSVSLALSFLSFSHTNTRHISAAAKGRDLLPGGDGCSVHASRTGADCTAFSLQQCWRVPRRRQGNQPQVARADIRHWYFAALPVHAGSTPGEDKFCIFVWFLESWLHSVVVCKFAYKTQRCSIRAWEEARIPWGTASVRASDVKTCQIKYAALPAEVSAHEWGSSRK